MTTTFLIILVMIVAVVAYLLSERSGPRVTHIETRREKDDGEKGE